MFRIPAKPLFAAAVALSALLSQPAIAPASAQVGVSISYNSFRSQLAPYGTWSRDPRWGEVWRPARQANFRPYSDGHWVNTREYGWLWVSNERFGDITYHYGRWVADPRRGWLWVPGYVWAPSWVVWRSGGGNIAWLPMPPGDNYYGNGSYSRNYDNRYGYNDWYGASYGNDRFLSLWIVVGQDRFADRNYRNYLAPRRTYGNFIAQSRDVTNYSTVNDYVVNRSIDNVLSQGTRNQRFQPVAASSVMPGNRMVTQATAGIQAEQRERRQRALPAAFDTAPVSGTPRFNSPAQAARPTVPAETRGSPRNGNGTSQDRSQRDRGPAIPQSERGAPVTTPGSGNATSQSRSQRERGPANPQAAVASQDRGNNGRGRDNARAQDNTPARANDAQPADNRKTDDGAKGNDNPGRGRGRN